METITFILSVCAVVVLNVDIADSKGEQHSYFINEKMSVGWLVD